MNNGISENSDYQFSKFIKCTHQNSSIFYTVEHIHKQTLNSQRKKIQATIKNTVQKAAHRLTSSTTSMSSLCTSPPNPHKRVAANLRERKRMRLINHAFNGLQSHLPKELLRPNTLLSSMNPKICTSIIHRHRNFNVELSNKQVDSQLILQSVNPTSSYFHKETISKVDVLRAAINYIHILEEILDELKDEHCPETWDSAADQMNTRKLDCKQTQHSKYHVCCLCSITHSNEDRVNKYHKQLMSGTVIKTGEIEYLMIF
ncbi:unnamed protein product [Schistosoma spindalis]|nr:unnamed protein product [Schistosoma spindale]